MKTFLVIYHAPASAMESMADMRPEDIQKEMNLWMAWAAKCGDALVDMGSMFAGSHTITRSGSSPSNKDAMAYSFLQADDIEGAKALLDGHPHLGWADGCEIEVHETAPTQM